MAIKVKEEKKHGKLYEIFTTEYKWETYLLGVLSAIAIAAASLMLTKVLVINENAFLVGKFPNVLIGLLLGFGIIGALLFLFPIFKPALPELKKLSLPNRRTFLGNTLRVFIFIIILSLLFLLYEAFISGIIGKI